MKPLSDTELNEIIKIATDTAEEYIFKQINKKELEDIEINVELDTSKGGLDIDITINLDTDFIVPDNLSSNAIDASIDAVDKYINEREEE